MLPCRTYLASVNLHGRNVQRLDVFYAFASSRLRESGHAMLSCVGTR